MGGAAQRWETENVPEVKDLRRHHLLIAGTGRAGTSFLVRFLAACGLETGEADWFEAARAGLEHRVDPDDPTLPYVLKDPALGTYCDRLDLGMIAVDALLVPIRELSAAAESRLVQERARLAASPSGHYPEAELMATTPGGAYASLNLLDQERLLAVGFHRLVRWAAVNDIPVVLLDFPRMAEDHEYLVDAVWKWLEPRCSRERARAAFDETADASLIRVRAPANGHRGPTVGPGVWVEPDIYRVAETEWTVTADPDVYMNIESAAARFVLAKTRPMVDRLAGTIAELRPHRIVELGIFKGGSAVLLDALAQPVRLTAVELSSEPVEALEQWVAAHGRQDAVRTHYGVDQGDVDALSAVIAADHGAEQLDLVVDDASHLYRETRTSFEVLFARLRPGGRYVIEDWGWAHFPEPAWQEGGGIWHDRPALTNLVIEILMIAATGADLIANVDVVRDMVTITRGPLKLDRPLSLRHHYRNRGLPFRPII